MREAVAFCQISVNSILNKGGGYMKGKAKPKRPARTITLGDIDQRLLQLETQIAGLVKLLDPVARTERLLKADGR